MQQVRRQPRIGVLAVHGDVREHLRSLAAAGADAIAVRRPAEVAEIDALVLPGGESTTIDKLLRIFELRDPIRQRIAAGMPAYGSCAGMILLAREAVDARPDQRADQRLRAPHAARRSRVADGERNDVVMGPPHTVGHRERKPGRAIPCHGPAAAGP